MNTKRYLPHELKTKYNAVITYTNSGDISYTCRKYHISRTSLWRWLKKFNGTKESLRDKSHRPHSRHPNSHTDEEIKNIKNLIRRNPTSTLNEIWYKLRLNYGYTRKPVSLYRILRRLGFYKTPNFRNTSKRHNQKYHTPYYVGQKWQIDVKYVPKECKTDNLSRDLDFYQYTCIDEATRQRYLFWYEEHTPENTVDFIKRCIHYYKYKPLIIQTDNGIEFSYNRSDIEKIHPMDKFLEKLNIKHYKIRPRTPEHNGKVERSHRNDNERFYRHLKFYSLEDLRKQGSRYIARSNRIPMAVLNFLTPIEKRRQLQLPVVV